MLNPTIEQTKQESVKIEFLMDSKEKGYLTALAGLMRHKSLEDFLTFLVTDELKSRYFSTNGRRHAELDFALDCWDIKIE
jgi:hypothetical protein